MTVELAVVTLRNVPRVVMLSYEQGSYGSIAWPTRLKYSGFILGNMKISD